MRRLRTVFPFLLSSSLLFAGCYAEPEPEGGRVVWLVHATDPHLFEAPRKDPKPDIQKRKEESRQFEEKRNDEAFRTLLCVLGSLPGSGARADYLVITGDFGIAEDESGPAPTSPAATATGSSQPVASEEVSPAAECSTATRAGRMTCLANALATSPIRDLYVVPGNNDVKDERADGLASVQSFFEKVEEKAGGKVAIHDLTGCYVGNAPLSQCWANIPDTAFRLIGFPSQSFKNRRTEDATGAITGDVRAENETEQARQMAIFANLVRDAGTAGRKVVVLTHIAEIDDPYSRAQRDFENQKGFPNRNDRPELSAWNVKPEIRQKWNELVRSDTVAGVLAGHFHDSHREIYRWPRRWATVAFDRPPLEKTLLAPPLAIRRQDASPVQARGFALLRLQGDRLSRRLYWLDPVRKRFDPDPEVRQPPRRIGVPTGVAWLWAAASDKPRLARAVVFAIALLAAFLTVVEVWQIPPPNTRAVTVARESQRTENGSVVQIRTEVEAGKGQAATFATYGSTALLFQTNFARTVLSGLAGLALVSAFDGLWHDLGIEEKPYFLVLFVIFFLLILFASALIRGGIEALRSRVSLSRRMPGDIKPRWKYWVTRFWFWVLSLRTAFLCFFDTFFNVIQGKNQLHTVEFENEIARLHESIVGGIDRVRQDLDAAFQEALERRKKAEDERRRKNPSPEPSPADAKVKTEDPWNLPLPKPADVRVNISLLSEDGGTVFYVSREEGSLAKGFGKSSVAWVSLFNSRALWWKETYQGKNIVLIEGEPPLYLADHYEPRTSPDYKGFIILPVPWGRRAEGEGRKAGIHVSFRKAEYMDWLWKGLDTYGNPGKEPEAGQAPPVSQGDHKEFLYSGWPGMLEFREGEGQGPWLHDRELSKVLRRSVLLLTELVHHFNDDVFEEYIRPRARPQ
jgi:hypothetical protein